MPKTFTVEVGGRILTFETGKMAAQASGAVFATYGETGVLITAVGSERLREGIDFLPLTVDYMEMSYAAGRIPGGFFRREIGRPSEKETLTSRLIDRPSAPYFPRAFITSCKSLPRFYQLTLRTIRISSPLTVLQQHWPSPTFPSKGPLPQCGWARLTASSWSIPPSPSSRKAASILSLPVLRRLW